MARSIPALDPASSSSSDEPASDASNIDPALLDLRNRLSPLLRTEEILIRRLTPAGSAQSEATQMPLERPKQVLTEVAINSATAWKDAFYKYLPGRNSFDSELAVDWDDPEDPGRVLHECAAAMKSLWGHPDIQKILEKQNMRLEEMAGLYVLVHPCRMLLIVRLAFWTVWMR